MRLPARSRTAACYRDGQFLDSMAGRGDALHPR